MTRFEKLKEIVDCFEEKVLKQVEKDCKKCIETYCCSELAHALFALRGDYDA